MLICGLFLALACGAGAEPRTASRARPAQMLVAMSGAGTVERYDAASGTHLGTLVRGVDRPNALAFGPDGALYVATGAVGGAGAVARYDGTTGRFLSDFVRLPIGSPGYLARASHLLWYGGDLLVVSSDDSHVYRYDGRTGAYKSTVATGNPRGWITQIAVREGAVYATEFAESRVRRFPLTEGEPQPYVAEPGFSPWGITFDPAGRCWWSGTGGIARYDGKSNTVVVPASQVPMPTALALSPGGLLACSSLGSQSVTLWDIAGERPRLTTTITEAVRDPAGVTFTDRPFSPPAQFGNFVPQPSNTGRNWKPTGTTVYNLRADAYSAAITDFGLDTEGGDRAKTQLLWEPMQLDFTLEDGRVIRSANADAKRSLRPGHLSYEFRPVPGLEARWRISREGDGLRMDVTVKGEAAARLKSVALVMPFAPRVMGTTVIAEEWGSEGAVFAPLIINALDMGQLRLSGVGKQKRLSCRFTGSRQFQRTELRVELLSHGARERRIELVPARLTKPSSKISDREWARVRRGLLALLQDTCYMPSNEGGSGWLGSPGGILGNNVISDPVSVNMDRNLQWLCGMGKHAKVEGIDLNRVARRTIEFWLNRRMNADGSLDYVLQTGNISADSNTGVLNAATDYYLSTQDTGFVRENQAVLVKAADYLVARDVDNDGLIETFRDGNGGNQFGDTGYDTVSSGWKNALVNGQAYKSLLGVARMLEDLGDVDRSAAYRRRALRLRKAYNTQFYDREKGRYLWWIGKNGRRHEYGNPLIQANAVLFGIADGLEQDTGLRKGSRDVMQRLWDDLAAAQYRDSARGKTVRYINPAAGDYTGFYWGIPCNLESVPPEFNFGDYGKHEFPYYCNGGIFPQDTVATIMAFTRVGMEEQAGLIRREIFRRQHEGILPNGSGFYMGVVNLPGQCYSILKWDGTPTDYEGIISRDCSFLQTAVLTDDPARQLFNAAGTAVR